MRLFSYIQLYNYGIFLSSPVYYTGRLFFRPPFCVSLSCFALFSSLLLPRAFFVPTPFDRLNINGQGRRDDGDETSFRLTRSSYVDKVLPKSPAGLLLYVFIVPSFRTRLRLPRSPFLPLGGRLRTRSDSD